MSQGKKKKQPKNAFYFYMMDYKKQQEDRGMKFPGGMKEVAEKAAPVWKNMSQGERWHYEEAARLEKQRDKGDLENKFTTHGKSYAQVEREHAELREQGMKMVQEIESTVRLLDSKSLSSFPFHIIHVNYFCRQESGMYTPCEIALTEFNFIDGIRSSYHTLINPGQIPLGYKYEARKISEETHQIPVPPDEYGGENDYYKIFTNVKRFVSGMKAKEVRPCYTHPNCLDAVKNVLGRLQEDLPERVEFRVYPLTKLFYELRNACVSTPGAVGFPAFSLAERELDRDVFNFEKGISCDFHEETDAIPHCSLSCVKRWAFLIMDYCCKDLGIDLIPGQHCPNHADVNRWQRVVSRPASVTGDSCGSSKNSVAKSRGHSTRPSKKQLGTDDKHAPATVAFNSNEVEDSLAPLRLPRTQSEAFRVMTLSEEEFPAVGATGGLQHESSGVWGRGQTPVFGRGRTAHLDNPITAGRGRGLAALQSNLIGGRGRGLAVSLEDDLDKMKLK